jgi:hypothetical protein
MPAPCSCCPRTFMRIVILSIVRQARCSRAICVLPDEQATIPLERFLNTVMPVLLVINYHALTQLRKSVFFVLFVTFSSFIVPKKNLPPVFNRMQKLPTFSFTSLRVIRRGITGSDCIWRNVSTTIQLYNCILQIISGVKGIRGRAIAEADSRWLPTAAARVQSRVWSSGICGGQKWRRGRFFPSTSVSPAIHSTKLFILTITRGRYNRSVSGRRADPVWTPPPTMQI